MSAAARKQDARSKPLVVRTPHEWTYEEQCLIRLIDDYEQARERAVRSDLEGYGKADRERTQAANRLVRELRLYGKAFSYKRWCYAWAKTSPTPELTRYPSPSLRSDG